MKKSTAFWIGVVGALMITVVTAIGRTMGMPMDIEMMLGSMLTGVAGGGTWLLGLLMHLVVGGIVAILYVELFDRVTHRAGLAIGIAFGAVHAVIAGLMLGVLPVVHPAMPGVVSAPGILAIHFGIGTTIAFILVHLAYGAIVGGAYARIAHRAQRPVAATARA